MRIRRFLITALALALLGGQAVAATPSVAPTTPLKVVGLHEEGLNIKVSLPSGVKAYEVQASTRSDYSGVKAVRKVSESNYVSGLTNNTEYHLRYRLLKKVNNSEVAGGWSKSVTARTNATFPAVFSSVSAKSYRDAVTVSWVRHPKKTNDVQGYKVLIANNAGMDKGLRTFTLSKTAASKKITGLNSRDGQIKYVRVKAVNGSKVRTSEAALVRPSAPAPTKGQQLTFATQNILCVTCKAKNGVNTPSIAKRIPMLLATVKQQKPGVLMLNEADNTKAGAKKGRLTPFFSGLSAQGYAMDRAIEANGASGKSNRVAYKKSLFKLVKNGTFAIYGKKSYAAWALLESKTTHERFYAVAAHMPPSASAADKVRSAKLISDTMKKLSKATKGKPVVILGGDMNVSQNSAPVSNPHTVFMDRAWTDMMSAPKRYMAEYPTYNGLAKTITPTWGRIDYLYSWGTGGPLTYRNVITVKNGKITSKHGSDHNMVVATTRLKK